MNNMTNKTFIKRLLSFYQEKEDDTDYRHEKYYTHSSFDDILTNFETLSNNNVIGIKTRLNHLDATIILFLFEKLYDNNYSYDDLEDLIDENNIYETINNLEEHFIVLFDEDTESSNLSIYGSTYISDTLPNVIDNSDINIQLYYTINDIIEKFYK